MKVSSIFYRWKNWGSKRLSWPMVTKCKWLSQDSNPCLMQICLNKMNKYSSILKYGHPKTIAFVPLFLSCSGFPVSFQSQSQLCHFLTMCVFTCTAQHAAINQGQVWTAESPGPWRQGDLMSSRPVFKWPSHGIWVAASQTWWEGTLGRGKWQLERKY